MATELWLIRHAESVWNAEGRWQGQGDPPLTERGRREARRLARALAEVGLGALVTSDLARARETAQILGAALGLEPRCDRRLRERRLGSWTGLTSAEIQARAPRSLARLRAGDPGVRPGGGETLAELRRRVARALAELAEGEPGSRIAVVTHLGVIRLVAAGAEPGNASFRRASLAACRAAVSGSGARTVASRRSRPARRPA